MKRGTVWGQIKKTKHRGHTKLDDVYCPINHPEGVVKEGKQALNHCLGKQNAFHLYVYLHTGMTNVQALSH